MVGGVLQIFVVIVFVKDDVTVVDGTIITSSNWEFIPDFIHSNVFNVHIDLTSMIMTFFLVLVTLHYT